MRHEARLGPTTIHTDTRVLHWKPNGKLETHGMRENPAKARTGRELLSARLFVGFNVGGKPRWTMEDVIRVTTEVRTRSRIRPSPLLKRSHRSSNKTKFTSTSRSAA